MRKFLLALSFSMLAAGAYAQTPATTCKSQSAEKNLHGAAEKSFLTKCERDARASCDSQAGEKNLRGAAKTSFVKKCVSDAVGP